MAPNEEGWLQTCLWTQDCNINSWYRLQAASLAFQTFTINNFTWYFSVYPVLFVPQA